MSIQVESDLKEILKSIDNKLDKLSTDVTDLKVSQAEVKGDIKRLDSHISTIKEDIKEIKGSQKAQIWTLIGILITAVGGFIVAVGRSVLSFNP
jgi:chromosome segregation ATPase